MLLFFFFPCPQETQDVCFLLEITYASLAAPGAGSQLYKMADPPHPPCCAGAAQPGHVEISGGNEIHEVPIALLGLVHCIVHSFSCSSFAFPILYDTNLPGLICSCARKGRIGRRL